MTNFHQFPTDFLENEHIRLEYLTTAGPRLVRLTYHGSKNMLADVPDIYWDTSHGKYYPLGGHRLWTSPELPEFTYLPDGEGLVVKKSTSSVELDWKGFDIGKTVKVELENDRPAVRLIHTVTNLGKKAVEFAPWVITMFRQGGVVLLPQPVGNADPNGLLHNRILAIWPYTRLTDPRLVLRDDTILLRAQPALPPVKLGYRNTAGWLAYWLDGVLFRKTFDLHGSEAAYPDGGCNAETYCNDRFVELESIGPLATLEPGKSVQFAERWEFYPDLNVEFIPATLRETLAAEGN